MHTRIVFQSFKIIQIECVFVIGLFYLPSWSISQCILGLYSNHSKSFQSFSSKDTCNVAVEFIQILSTKTKNSIDVSHLVETNSTP